MKRKLSLRDPAFLALLFVVTAVFFFWPFLGLGPSRGLASIYVQLVKTWAVSLLVLYLLFNRAPSAERDRDV
ncbi:MAG: hypothetical protein NDJ90_03425 [Oligoflexia bacterium]|nr:hypothetical protein [Oligoflexia bacterium]